MRKFLIAASAVALMAAAAPAFAAPSPSDPFNIDQGNLANQQAQGESINTNAGALLTTSAQSIGDLTQLSTEGASLSVTALTQVNSGDQLSVSSVTGVGSLHDATTTAKSFGNSASLTVTTSNLAAGNSLSQNNSGTQTALAFTGNQLNIDPVNLGDTSIGVHTVGGAVQYVSGTLDTEASSVGSSLSLTGDYGVTGASTQINTGKQASAALAGGVNVTGPSSLIATSAGNSLDTNTGSQIAFTTNQTNLGEQGAVALAYNLTSGGTANLSATALGNTANYNIGDTGNVSWGQVTQANFAPQVSLATSINGSFTGSANIAASSVGNAFTSLKGTH